MWLDVGSAASGLALSTFWGQVGDIMGFVFFLADLPCILEIW